MASSKANKKRRAKANSTRKTQSNNNKTVQGKVGTEPNGSPSVIPEPSPLTSPERSPDASPVASPGPEMDFDHNELKSDPPTIDFNTAPELNPPEQETYNAQKDMGEASKQAEASENDVKYVNGIQDIMIESNPWETTKGAVDGIVQHEKDEPAVSKNSMEKTEKKPVDGPEENLMESQVEKFDHKDMGKPEESAGHIKKEATPSEVSSVETAKKPTENSGVPENIQVGAVVTKPDVTFNGYKKAVPEDSVSPSSDPETEPVETQSMESNSMKPTKSSEFQLAENSAKDIEPEDHFGEKSISNLRSSFDFPASLIGYEKATEDSEFKPVKGSEVENRFSENSGDLSASKSRFDFTHSTSGNISENVTDDLDFHYGQQPSKGLEIGNHTGEKSRYDFDSESNFDFLPSNSGYRSGRPTEDSNFDSDDKPAKESKDDSDEKPTDDFTSKSSFGFPSSELGHLPEKHAEHLEFGSDTKPTKDLEDHTGEKSSTISDSEFNSEYLRSKLGREKLLEDLEFDSAKTRVQDSETNDFFGKNSTEALESNSSSRLTRSVFDQRASGLKSPSNVDSTLPKLDLGHFESDLSFGGSNKKLDSSPVDASDVEPSKEDLEPSDMLPAPLDIDSAATADPETGTKIVSSTDAVPSADVISSTEEVPEEFDLALPKLDRVSDAGPESKPQKASEIFASTSPKPEANSVSHGSDPVTDTSSHKVPEDSDLEQRESDVVSNADQEIKSDTFSNTDRAMGTGEVPEGSNLKSGTDAALFNTALDSSGDSKLFRPDVSTETDPTPDSTMFHTLDTTLEQKFHSVDHGVDPAASHEDPIVDPVSRAISAVNFNSLTEPKDSMNLDPPPEPTAAGKKPSLGSPFHDRTYKINLEDVPRNPDSQPPPRSDSVSPLNPVPAPFDDDIDLDDSEDFDETQVVSAVPVRIASADNNRGAAIAGSSNQAEIRSPIRLEPVEKERIIDSPDSIKPEIPQRSIARSVEPENVEMLEARHETFEYAKPVMLTSIAEPNSREDIDEGKETQEDEEFKEGSDEKDDEDDRDDIKYKEAAVTAEATEATEVIEVIEDKEDREIEENKEGEEEKDTEGHKDEDDFNFTETVKSPLEIPQLSHPTARQTIRRVDPPPEDTSPSRASLPDAPVLETSPERSHPFALSSPISSPQISPLKYKLHNQSVEDLEHNALGDHPREWMQNARSRNSRILQSPPKLDPPSAAQNKRLSSASLSSPTASPRPYKYMQSPLPTETDPNFKPEPPIFGVGVVGFHHQRGPEVEYWVGPEGSNSNMWPYLPFQSLPDGSHQFEENISYFTLSYDRNKASSTSLTFTRDEEGHIQAGTSDFRDVTTLFGIACSRQVSLDKLDTGHEDNKEYTRSIVQKSVVVIASKPIFGPIKEKSAVVTRSYFEQHNFGDREIINNFYDNLVQMPSWINDNDLQVGMNLQRCVHNFGLQVLVILKAMLIESKILFYANDTDILGTTQFALISLVPDLINHLEDSGSPLLSSYELNIKKQPAIRTSDRQSILKYSGFPLQLFAGGGVFSPFVPSQQFEDLKQPETRYGMMGTTNNLFLGNDIDFDLVVNIETNEVTIRNPNLVPLLKSTEADRAFFQKIVDNVKQAWDIEDRWQPQALGYIGGEDYIRHEIEEYLMAMSASVKEAKATGNVGNKSVDSNHASQTSFGTTNDAASIKSISSNATNIHMHKKSHLQAWNKQFVEKWMTTNNHRIFDRSTDDKSYELVNTEHPGIPLIKPSGFDRFFGFFKKAPVQSPKKGNQSPQLLAAARMSGSGTSSSVHTPILECDERFQAFTPSRNRHTFNANDFPDSSSTPTRDGPPQQTPRSWFARSST